MLFGEREGKRVGTFWKHAKVGEDVRRSTLRRVKANPSCSEAPVRLVTLGGHRHPRGTQRNIGSPCSLLLISHEYFSLRTNQQHPSSTVCWQWQCSAPIAVSGT
jgi:hypothetical protein